MDPIKAKANFSRVCQLLVDKGGDALRAALHAKHAPSTLAGVLNANKSILKKIRYSVIKAPQWNLLFPPSGTPDSKNFDITLLTILLRNICGLASPAAGWTVKPAASDTSISANISRIKIFRNEVYGHIPSAQYDDTTFQTLWQEISKPLINLGIPQHDINELKELSLSPEEESYVEKIKEWKELEDDLLSKLNCVEREVGTVKDEVVTVKHEVITVKDEVVELRKIVENATPSQVDQLAKFDFTGKIDGLCKKFHDGTRQWFFDKLSSWFTDDGSRVMILTAGPGVGKSVLTAKVCELYKQSGQLAAYHFCDFRNSDYSNPHRILQSLASQMCDHVDGFKKKLTEVLCREHSRHTLSDAFRVLLNDPLHTLASRVPMLIVVDALDESKTDSKSELFELISDQFPELPKWIKILISSRPELQVRKKLQQLNPTEILPDDHDHKIDLQRFIRWFFPDLNVSNVNSLISKFEGSFLYAYFLVNELKQMDLGIEPNLNDYVPKGISAFYEKQFQRLKTSLRRLKPDAWSPVLKCFVNVVAASREPLPIRILFESMGLSREEYELREAIIEIISEILPVYDDCLTVYHKSLWDWLTLDGYEEHAFQADVGDGTKRLWCACKSIYSDKDSLRSVSGFQVSPEKSYALKNGANYLVMAGDTEDFHWLVNVRINFLKLKFCHNLNVDIDRVLRICKSRLPLPIYWGIIQLHAFLEIIKNLQISFETYHKEKSYIIYLQSLANNYFDAVENTTSCKKEARDILDKTNEIWLEKLETEINSNFKIISYAILGNADIFLRRTCPMALSSDNKLLACFHERGVEVFDFPSLTLIFKVEVCVMNGFHSFLTFSPDSSYLLYNSVRYCVSIREQKEVPFIPRGPEDILYASFSSCGTKLVTSEKSFIKVWDVRRKVLLVQVETEVDVEYCFFSSCSSYILVRPWENTLDFDAFMNFDDFVVLKSETLERLDLGKICADTCLTYEDCYQIISPPPWGPHGLNATARIRHFHLPTGEIVLISTKYCSKPFTWKDRKCVAFSNSSQLVVYDFINQEKIDLFHINCLLSTNIGYIFKLDEKKFLLSLNSNQVFLLSFEASEESTVFRSFNNPAIKCCALSPDDLYVACCYENRILTIRSVDNKETLQILALKKTPEACWWSESYLWVVCKGVIVTYHYEPTHTNNVLRNCLNECFLNFESIVKFAEGVLVIRLNDNGDISIIKICNEKLCPQQIPDSHFSPSSVAISSDGCALLLYRKSISDYQLWEIASESENRWEIRLTGKLDKTDAVKCFCLTGNKKFRSSLWLMYICTSFVDALSEPLRLSSIDFPNGTNGVWHELPISHIIHEVLYLGSNILIIREGIWIHFIKVLEGKIIAKLFIGFIGPSSEVSSFYIASSGLLLLVKNTSIKYFKIHNIANLLTEG